MRPYPPGFPKSRVSSLKLKEEPMKRLFTVLLCAMVVAASFACGEDKGNASKQAQAKAPTQAQKSQQERMSACNKQAGEKKLKGDARKKFMSACLEGKSTVASAKRQKVKRDRAGDCNQQANLRNLEGEERTSFMRSCLR